MRPLLIFILFILFTPSGVIAQMPVLQSKIDVLARDVNMKPANWGICVMDMQTGEILASHEPYKSLPTASTLKTVTTATALATLGPDYRFETTISYQGEINDEGVLTGNIIISGTGDPTLGSDRISEEHGLEKLMTQWALAIKGAGITKIQGKIIGDATWFSTQMTPPKWSWEDMGNYYGAGASGLNCHENMYTLYLKPGAKAGSATHIIRTLPDIDADITFINELTTGPVGSGDQAYIYGAPYTDIRYLRGSIPAGKTIFSIKGSISEPALFCARTLSEYLRTCGVTLSGKSSTARIEKIAGNVNKGKVTKIFTHQSPPLKEIIIPLNYKSINLYAECLLNAVAVHKGKEGRTQEAAEVVTDYWKNQGIETRSMFIRDGSGLSPNNALSTYQFVKILSSASKASYYSDFYAALPVAGRSGAMENMLKGTIAEGKLRAKSGYIAGARGYVGYATTQSGRKVAFAMLAHNYGSKPGPMRKKMEKLMVEIVEGK